MPIDINSLSEAELVDLNHRIVERLRFLHQIHAHHTMLKFSIGDRVTFEDGQGRKVEGTLVVRHGFETPGCACSGGQG